MTLTVFEAVEITTDIHAEICRLPRQKGNAGVLCHWTACQYTAMSLLLLTAICRVGMSKSQ